MTMPTAMPQRSPKSHNQARKTHCPQNHPYDDDNTYRDPRGGRRCRACSRSRPRSEKPGAERARRLRRYYGMTVEQYDALLEAQSGVCAICHRPETRRDTQGRVAPLVVDHDHVTGDVRGLLCHHCNVTLGFIRDDPRLLDSIRDYLGSRP